MVISINDLKPLNLFHDFPLFKITEYRSFLTDAPADYAEHVDKKSKTLLARLQMLYILKEKIKPDQNTQIPKVLGNNINKWWAPEDDRDLLIGVVKHGYGQ